MTLRAACEEPWQTVGREHRDRMVRLQRLARIDGIVPPQIYEYSIPQSEHKLADYPVAIPIARVVFREQVFFDFNSVALKPAADAVLSTIADTLQNDVPDVAVFVAGHTDSIGSWDYNLDLGLRRARAVVAALIQKKGLVHVQLFEVSFGKAVPIDSNDTEAGRARSRRVEFLFAARPQPVAAWLARQPACVPEQRDGVDACPQHLSFSASQIRVQPRPGTLPVQPSPAQIDRRSAPVPILIESRKVDIDLTNQVFEFRAPE